MTIRASYTTQRGTIIAAVGLETEAVDFSANLGAFWERNYAAASDLRGKFELDGNGFIADSLIRESEEDYLPLIYEGRVSRHLFLVSAPN